MIVLEQQAARTAPASAIRVAFEGHLDLEQAARVLDAAGRQLEGSQPMIVDCRRMTGYDAEARQHFVDWHREHSSELEAVAVITEKAIWHFVVGTMSWLAGVNMRSFSRLEDAKAWIGDADRAVPSVRGVALIGPLKYLKIQFPRYETRVREQLRKDTAELIGSRVRKLSRYPYPVFVDILRTFARVTSNGDLESVHRLGRFCANEDFASTHKLLAQLNDPERLICACARVWAGYYEDAGHMEVLSSEAENTVLAVRNFPDMDKAHSALMTGWMHQALVNLGAAVTEHSYEHQVEAGTTTFRFRWSVD